MRSNIGKTKRPYEPLLHSYIVIEKLMYRIGGSLRSKIARSYGGVLEIPLLFAFTTHLTIEINGRDRVWMVVYLGWISPK